MGTESQSVRMGGGMEENGEEPQYNGPERWGREHGGERHFLLS